MSIQGDDFGNYSSPCSIHDNETCKAVMSHLMMSLLSAYSRCLSFFCQRSDTLSKLNAGRMLMILMTLVTDERCVNNYCSLVFTVCNVVRCTGLFCGREELETIVDVHSLVSDGH